MKHAKDGRWEEALQALQSAANSDPKNETYSSALARAEEEVGFGEKLEKARAFVKEGKLGDGLDLLRGIPSSSSIAAEAVREAQQVEQRYEEEEGERLRDLISEGQFEQAKEEVGPFAERLPDSEDVQAMKTALDNGKRAAALWQGASRGRFGEEVRSQEVPIISQGSSSKGDNKHPRPIAPPKAKKEKKPVGAVLEALSMYRVEILQVQLPSFPRFGMPRYQFRCDETLGDIQSFQALTTKGRQPQSGLIKPLSEPMRLTTSGWVVRAEAEYAACGWTRHAPRSIGRTMARQQKRPERHSHMTRSRDAAQVQEMSG